MSMPIFHIFGGGTFSHTSPHYAGATPVFGGTARRLAKMAFASSAGIPFRVQTTLTKMADPSSEIVTNDDLAAAVDAAVADPDTRVIIFSAAPVDFDMFVEGRGRGLGVPRLKTDEGPKEAVIVPTPKIINRIREKRKDIFLVGFKSTSGETRDEQYLAGLKLLKSASCNLVVANDLLTKFSMIITPEQAAYHESFDRNEVLRGLIEMVLLRSQGTFTRSTVEPGEPVAWSDPRVPDSLRTVVNHCIARGAYKPFRGSTVGHFAVNLGGARDGSEQFFLTSRRKTDFNRLDEVGLVLVKAVDSGPFDPVAPSQVIAYGSKPSVGGQSQRIIFRERSDADCIVHAHVPMKPGSMVPVRSQRPHECGSHQCGKNTSDGLRRFQLDEDNYLYAVMLDKHGPNIVFPRKTNPDLVIKFIEDNFDLAGRTDNVDPEVAKKYASKEVRA